MPQERAPFARIASRKRRLKTPRVCPQTPHLQKGEQVVPGTTMRW
jgi:hypothetical protein